MTPSEAVAALSPVVSAMERLGVAYYLGGSVASSTCGIARSTLDIDLVADLAAVHANPLADALKDAYYADRRMIADAIARRSCFNLIHLATSFKVDVFVLKDRPYDRVALQRARKKPIETGTAPAAFFFASPEDVILSKLEWYRLGDEVSQTQWRDVLGVIKVQGESLDRVYLQTWAAELGLADLLQRVWQEAQD